MSRLLIFATENSQYFADLLANDLFIVIIYDNMVRGGGTLVNAALAYLEHGATQVYAMLSHLAFNNEEAIQKVIDSPITKVLGTNPPPYEPKPLSHKLSQVPGRGCLHGFHQCHPTTSISLASQGPTF